MGTSYRCRSRGWLWAAPALALALAAGPSPAQQAQAQLSLVEPLVTLNVANQRLSDVLKYVSAQTGYNFDQAAMRMMAGRMPGGQPGQPGQGGQGGASRFLDMLDPQITTAANGFPLGYVLDVLARQYNQRVQRVGGTYYVLPAMGRNQTQPPFRVVNDLGVMVNNLRYARTTEHSFGPRPAHQASATLTLEIGVDGATALADAKVAGISVESVEATVLPEATTTFKPEEGLSGTLLATNPANGNFELPFELPAGAPEVKAVRQVNLSLRLYDQMAERLVALDPAQAGAKQAVGNVEVTLNSFTPAAGETPATADLTITTKLGPTAVEQLKSLPIDAAGKIDVGSALDNAQGGGGRGGMANMRTLPAWLVPVVAFEKAPAGFVYGRIGSSSREFTLQGDTLTAHVKATWQTAVPGAKRLAVSVIDPGPTAKDQIVIVNDIAIPAPRPDNGNRGFGGPGGMQPGMGGPGGMQPGMGGRGGRGGNAPQGGGQ